MKKSTITIKKYFLQLHILHAIFVLGQVAFGFMVYKVASLGLDASISTTASSAGSPFVLIIIVLLNEIIGKMQLNIISKVEPLTQKLRGYFIFQLLRWVILTAGVTTILALIFFSGNIALFTYAIAAIGVLIYFRPSIKRTIKELQLNHADQELLNTATRL